MNREALKHLWFNLPHPTPKKEVTSATKQSNWESFNEPELAKPVSEEVNITPAPKKEENDGWGNFYVVKDII